MSSLLTPAVPVNPQISAVLPQLLAELPRWTAWDLRPARKPGGKPAKVPRSLTNDQTTWRTLPEVLALQASGGVGLQMLGASTFVGIDLDDCREPDTGVLSSFAQSLLSALPDTYAEVTPSGKGLRIFATVPDIDAPPPEFLSRAHGVECYVGKSARFLTVTGEVLDGRAQKLAAVTPRALALLRPLAAAAESVTDLSIELPQPAFERVAEWKALLNARFPYSKFTRELKDYLEKGDLPGGRSEKTFSVALRLLEARYQPEEVFAFLISAPGPWEAALDKRDQDPVRARTLIWHDIGRAQKIIRVETDDIQNRLDSWQALGLRVVVQGKKVVVQQTQANAARILESSDEWRGRLALDTSSATVLLDDEPLDDHRFFLLQERVSMFTGWQPFAQRQWWGDTIRAVAARNPRNPRAAYLRSLKWDGMARLSGWFVAHVTARDTELDRQIGRKWLIGLVARWLDPGCKLDTVLVLQGEEGYYKTTFFEAIAGAPERVAYLEGFEKDDKMTMAQAWVVEVPEAHLFRRADRNRLKAFITKSSDEYRPPYASAPVTVKRSSVLVSTCNPGEIFTSDQDGLRRFWLAPVRKIDIEWVRANRDQLLAEAVQAYDAGEKWWFDDTPSDLRERVGHAVEVTAVDDALDALVTRRVGEGGMPLPELLSEISATLGVRPQERYVVPLLRKHGIIQRRDGLHRFWLHPSWARPGKAGEADVIPLKRVYTAVKNDDEILS